jgi:hypothetical protein
MPRYSLRQLDRKTVALRLISPNGWPIMRGLGRFDEGALALYICIEDSGGSFEFVFYEEQWQGQIESGESFACDFAIRLNEAGNLPRTALCKDHRLGMRL